LPSVLLYTELK